MPHLHIMENKRLAAGIIAFLDAFYHAVLCFIYSYRS